MKLICNLPNSEELTKNNGSKQNLKYDTVAVRRPWSNLFFKVFRKYFFFLLTFFSVLIKGLLRRREEINNKASEVLRSIMENVLKRGHLYKAAMAEYHFFNN